MKTILVATDFSATSHTAVHFALYVASALKADLTLCHALKTLGAANQVFPNEYTRTREEAIEQLEFQACDLRFEQQESGIAGPQLDYCIALGTVPEVVRRQSQLKPVTLVVMGMVGAGVVNRRLLSINNQDMINEVNFPVLLIPFKKFPEKINKIAFASDLSKGDIGLINSLLSFARAFNAEILIVHIGETRTDQDQVDSFLTEVTGKINYPKIYYRHVEDKNANRGLNWIAKNGSIDMFAMVHRKQASRVSTFSSSHMQRLSRDIEVPLLVFQENQYPVF